MALASLYEAIFARVYDPLLYLLEKRSLARRRRQLLSGLEGHILEVGSGTGVNFSFYSNRARVLAMEPSAAMWQRAGRRLQKSGQNVSVNRLLAGIDDPICQLFISPASLDAIVSTLVLCTVPDMEKAVDHFYHWLKPGGTLVILEHVHSHRSFERKVLSALTPLWKKVALGCHLNRPTDVYLREAGFELVEEEYFRLGLPFYQARYRRL